MGYIALGINIMYIYCMVYSAEFYSTTQRESENKVNSYVT